MAIKSTTDERNPMRLRSVTRDFITATPSITASTNTAMSQTPKNNVNSSASTQLSSKKSKILEGVLKTMTEDELRNYLSDLSKTMPSVKGKLEQDFITQGKRIVRYRDGDEDDFDLDSYYEDMESDPEGGVRVRPITIGDEEYTARISACVNCGQCFDLTQNRSKVCHWHSGTQIDRLGKWDCCFNLLLEPGCTRTRHKSEINVVQEQQSLSSSSKKRKAGELEKE